MYSGLKCENCGEGFGSHDIPFHYGGKHVHTRHFDSFLEAENYLKKLVEHDTKENDNESSD